MGTPAFAVPILQKLLASDHEVVCVYTQPPRPAGRGQKEKPSPIHNEALAANIPVRTPTTLRTPDIQEKFAALKADAAIVAAYGLLLPPTILNACPYGCINIHPSLLPRWRGAAPIHRPLLTGDNETGVTIMQMDKGLDTGDILMVEKIPLLETDTYETLHNTLASSGGELLLKTLDALEHKRLTPIKQSENGVTYANKLTKEEGRINWQLPADAIHRMIRAFTPWPGAYFCYLGETIKILQADFDKTPHHAIPGTVLDKDFTIACGEGTLKPNLIQRAGHKKMECHEFLRGFPLTIGSLAD